MASPKGQFNIRVGTNWQHGFGSPRVLPFKTSRIFKSSACRCFVGDTKELLEFPSVFQLSKHTHVTPLGILTFMAFYGLHENQTCWNPQVFCVYGPSQHALIDGGALTDDQKHWKIQQFGLPQPRRINVQKPLGIPTFQFCSVFETMGAGHCAGCKQKECLC